MVATRAAGRGAAAIVAQCVGPRVGNIITLKKNHGFKLEKIIMNELIKIKKV